MPTDRPMPEASVFVVTYGRSGSTVLQNLLNALPGHLIRGENEGLVAPLARAWNMVDQSEQQAKLRAAGAGQTERDPWFGYPSVEADAFGAALADGFLRQVLRPEADTRVVGFKEIRWHNDPALFPVTLDFLRRFMPRARFVFNTRDHDEVVRSGWWKRMNPDVVRRELERAETLYDAYAGRHPSCCIRLHYNAFIQGPEAMRPLFDLLDLPFDADLVRRVMGDRLGHLQNV